MRKTADGLIIKERAVGESDKLLTVLTADGRITLSAKGVRSLKSKNMSVCRLFTYANFEFYEKNERYWLASGEKLRGFIGLETSLEKLSLACYVAEIANEISGEEAADETLLRATLNTLYAIENELQPPEIIKGTYELFAAAHSGLLGSLSVCERCGGQPAADFYLDVMNGTLLCSECLGAASLPRPRDESVSEAGTLLPLTREVLMAINYVVHAPVSKLFSFKLTKEEDVALFSRVGETYLQNHLEHGFDTLKFFHSDFDIPEPKSKERNAK